MGYEGIRFRGSRVLDPGYEGMRSGVQYEIRGTRVLDSGVREY